MVKQLMGLLLSLPCLVHGQDAGIQFEAGLNWKQVQAKAKTENKYIFVDCYATWCGPCKWMSAKIFPDKEAGDYMNSHFINVAVQMDKTEKDDQPIKEWYADAVMLHDLYKIGSYPSYLIFSSDGGIVHRFSGMRGNVNAFLDAVKEAFDPAKQYYSIMKQWSLHKQDTAYLMKAYLTARSQHDEFLADSIGQAYLNNPTDPFTVRNLRLVSNCHIIKSSRDKWFKLYLDNTSRIDEILNDQNWAEEALSPIIFDETTLSLFGKNGTFMDWKMISARIKADYPTIGEKLVRISEGLFQDHIYRVLDATISKDTATTMTEDDWSKISGILNKRFKGYDYHHILLQEKANYYAAKKLWPDCTNSTYALIRQYGDKMGNLDLNNRCWEVIFLHSADPKILSEAAKQVKGSIDRNPNKDFSMSIDTYANLLYKLGKRNEALTWENRAIEISIKYNGDPRDLNDFKTNLAKMQQGKSTWEN